MSSNITNKRNITNETVVFLETVRYVKYSDSTVGIICNILNTPNSNEIRMLHSKSAGILMIACTDGLYLGCKITSRYF